MDTTSIRCSTARLSSDSFSPFVGAYCWAFLYPSILEAASIEKDLKRVVAIVERPQATELRRNHQKSLFRNPLIDRANRSPQIAKLSLNRAAYAFGDRSQMVMKEAIIEWPLMLVVYGWNIGGFRLERNHLVQDWIEKEGSRCAVFVYHEPIKCGSNVVGQMGQLVELTMSPFQVSGLVSPVEEEDDVNNPLDGPRQGDSRG